MHSTPFAKKTYTLLPKKWTRDDNNQYSSTFDYLVLIKAYILYSFRMIYK